jgi:hypothetical protein
MAEDGGIHLVYVSRPTILVAGLLVDSPSEISEHCHWVLILPNNSCGNIASGDDCGTRSSPIGNWRRQQT